MLARLSFDCLLRRQTVIGEAAQPLSICIMPFGYNLDMKPTAVLAGEHFEFRDGKLYLNGILNTFTAESFPAIAVFDALFQFALDAEDFGETVLSDWVLVGPDGEEAQGPEQEFTLPVQAPGVITGWHRILKCQLGIKEPGNHELRLRVNGNVVATIPFNMNQGRASPP